MTFHNTLGFYRALYLRAAEALIRMDEIGSLAFPGGSTQPEDNSQLGEGVISQRSGLGDLAQRRSSAFSNVG